MQRTSPSIVRLFEWVWRQRFVAATINGRGPRRVRITGWRSCWWDRTSGTEHVKFLFPWQDRSLEYWLWRVKRWR